MDYTRGESYAERFSLAGRVLFLLTIVVAGTIFWSCFELFAESFRRFPVLAPVGIAAGGAIAFLFSGIFVFRQVGIEFLSETGQRFSDLSALVLDTLTERFERTGRGVVVHGEVVVVDELNLRIQSDVLSDDVGPPVTVRVGIALSIDRGEREPVTAASEVEGTGADDRSAIDDAVGQWFDETLRPALAEVGGPKEVGTPSSG